MTGGPKQLEIALLTARQAIRAIWLMPFTELQFMQLQFNNGLLQTTLSVPESARKILIAILPLFQY